MRTKNLLKLAFTMLAMIVMTGAMAQTVTVTLQNGAEGVGATLHEIVNGVDQGAVLGTADATGVINYSVVTGTMYAVKTATQRNSFTAASDGEDVVIKLYPIAIATDYVQVAETTFQTASKSFRFYVAPDPVYSPDYDGTDATDINTNSRWTWNLGGLSADAPWADNVTAINQNYVQISTPAAGLYTIEVNESNNLTGCADASTVTQQVRVIDAPSAAISGTSAAVGYSWTDLSADAHLTYRSCVAGTPDVETVTITITESQFLPVHLRSYAFSINQVVENLKSDLSTVEDVAPFTTATTAWEDYTLASKLKTGNGDIPAAHTWTPNDVGTATSTYVFDTPTLEVLNGKPTRYTFNIYEASDLNAAENGIVSAISQKSDYQYLLDNAANVVRGHAFGTKTQLVYIVLPAPVTGPIYHIPNNFAL